MVAITWVIVCDGAFCRILQHRDGSEQLEPVATIEGDHRPNKEINTDDAGRTFDSCGTGRHRYEPKHSPHEMLKHHFVTQIITEVEEKYREKKFNGIVFVSPPHILGIIRDKIPKSLENLVKGEVNKDLTHSCVSQIFAELRPILLPMESFKEQLEIKG